MERGRGIILIFSKKIIDHIFDETSFLLNDVTINKSDLLEEVEVFELTMKNIKQHPWQKLSIEIAHRDTSSTLYNKIQTSYVGSDPEEDYKEVIVWKIANMLFVTAAVDHDPNYAVKWDVVVFND